MLWRPPRSQVEDIVKYIRFICIGLIVLGVVLRAVNLDQKIYTVDEVRGLLRASGYTSQEFIAEVAARDITTAQTLQQYQLPTSQRNFGDALNAFKGNPEHPPLYYALARFAMQLTGTSVASRGLAAALGMLTLATMYWLCYELFQSSDIAWINTAVMAISPFHVMLASEARQYTLWAFLATGSSACLLCCINHNRLKGWLAYGLTLVLGLYTHLFFVWIMLTHGLYIVCLNRTVLRRYVVVSMLSIVAFIPWLWVIITNLDRLETTTKWASQYNADLLTRLGFWLNNICIGFVDFQWSASLKNPIVYLFCALILACIYLLCKYTPRRVWLFVLLLAGVTAMGQIVPDLIFGGRRSLLSRYGLTSYIGLQMAVAYGIYHGWRWLRRGSMQLALLTLGLTMMVLGGIVSSGLTSQSLEWGKGSSGMNLAIAPIINQAQSPLIIGDEDTYMLSLSYLVNPDVEFKLLNNSTVEPKAILTDILAKKDERARFLYFPSNELLETVGPGWQLKSLIADTPWFSERPILYQLWIQ